MLEGFVADGDDGLDYQVFDEVGVCSWVGHQKGIHPQSNRRSSSCPDDPH